MPSRTLTHAMNGAKVPLNIGIPKSDTRGFVNEKFLESNGAALASVQNALFGKTRLARDRIYWAFPPSKDPRVAALLKWIDTNSQQLAAFGLHKFLQTRERGALITNVEYRLPEYPNVPVFDWYTFDYFQHSMDKILQESVASYDAEAYVVIFVMLSSKSGNSVAMWRRKVYFSKDVRRLRQGEVEIALSALRKDEDYKIYLDE
ncbi:hypothetical protein BDQ17DRAFT_1236230 [Cyathus striatus]|nr:hypothetical protein BDQ17DRAFT_1236230 [Cyathus striatus]